MENGHLKKIGQQKSTKWVEKMIDRKVIYLGTHQILEKFSYHILAKTFAVIDDIKLLKP